MKSYEEFKKLMQEYIKLLDTLIVTENNKIKAVAAGDLEAVNESLKIEEAEMLRMRGLDGKRERFMKENGTPGATFGKTVESIEGDRKAEINAVYLEMKEKTERLKELSASSKNMLESKIIRTETTLNRLGSSGAAYDRNGERREAPPIMRNRPRKA